MTVRTPLLHAKGVYELETPWEVEDDAIYECIAIRSFVDLEKLGQKVYDLFYNPRNIDQARYETDRVQNANIITLVSSTHPTIYVPDTFITKYPDLSNVKYNRLVLSIDLGPMPDDENLIYLADQFSGVVSDVTGVQNAEVKIHVGPSTGIVTQAEHQAIQNARQAAITRRDTDYAKLIEVNQQNVELRAKLQTLEQIILNSGLLPP